MTEKHKGKVFILDDDELISSMLSRTLRKEGYEVMLENTTDHVVDKIRSFSPDVVMLDIMLPKRSGIDILVDLKKQDVGGEAVMLTADDTAETAVKAMKLGAADYLTKPINLEEVKIVLKNLIEKARLRSEIDYLRRVNEELFEKEIIGESPALRGLKEKVQRVAQAHVQNILITGESGTGKEVLARFIHRSMFGSPSLQYAPFVAINCTALPENLIESELFGHEKGSFTDAKTDKKGVFELADGGTLLLDEIGDMRIDLQAKLLRVLEAKTVRRIGGTKDIPFDVTVIATTNRDLKSAVEGGSFRTDLFYRLNAFTISIPPLRDRREDIPLLAAYFLVYYTGKYRKKAPIGFSPEATEILTAYQWPGNVRELRNVVERIAVLENEDIIRPEHLPAEIIQAAASGEYLESSDHRRIPEHGVSLEEIERDLLQKALVKARDNVSLAAKLLNISRDTLRYRIKKYGLK